MVLKSDGGAAAFHDIRRLLMGTFTARVIAAMQTITNEAPETSQNSLVRQHALSRTAHSAEPSTDPIIITGIMRANDLLIVCCSWMKLEGLSIGTARETPAR